MTATPNLDRARQVSAGLPPPPLPAPENRSETDLWLYWTAGKGRAKWTTAAKPLLALHAELAKHMPPLKAHTAALSWFEDGLGRKPRVSDGTLPEVPA